MKMVGKIERSYKQTYKKQSSTSDPYLPKGASRKISVCGGCHAVYKNKRWYGESALYDAVVKISGTAATVCPACLKIRDNFPGGIVTLKGDYVLPHKQDLLNLIRNEEARARGFNPLRAGDVHKRERLRQHRYFHDERKACTAARAGHQKGIPR